MSHNDLQMIPAQKSSGCLDTDAAFPWREALPMGNVSSIPTRHLPYGNYLQTCGMGTIERIYAARALAVKSIIDSKFGGVKAEFAEKADVNVATVSHWFMKKENGGKKIGEEMARHIEDELGLPVLSLDKLDPAEQNSMRHSSRLFAGIERQIQRLEPAEFEQVQEAIILALRMIEGSGKSADLAKPLRRSR